MMSDEEKQEVLDALIAAHNEGAKSNYLMVMHALELAEGLMPAHNVMPVFKAAMREMAKREGWQ